MTSVRWFAVLQAFIAIGLVMILWSLHATLSNRPFFRWWAWAWTSFALFLVIGVLAVPLAQEWTSIKGSLVFLATACGFLQPPLLVFGARSLHSPGMPTRRWRNAGIGLALAAGSLSFAVSLLWEDPLDSFSVRLAPRTMALAGAAFFCAAVFLRRCLKSGSWASGTTGIFCLLYGINQSLYGVAAIGRVAGGSVAPFASLFDQTAHLRPQLFLFDVINAYGICLGMVLLLVEDFQRSQRALEESRSLRREAADETVALQAEIGERRRVERALRESEDRYRDLVEHSEDLICTHDLEGRILSINNRPARILGYEPEELRRLTVRELLAPEVRHEFDAYLATIQRDGVAHGVMTILTRTGERRIWKFKNTLRTDGVPIPVVRGMAHDVTERLHAEQALRRSEAKFATAFRANPCAVAISTLEDGRVLDVNDGCERQTGYHRSEVIGRTSLQLGLWVDPSERASVLADLKGQGQVANREVRWRSKSGEVLTILYSADTIEIDGQRCVLSVAEDITAHKRVEARHRAILRALPDWMFLLSKNGVFLDFHARDRKYLLMQPEAFIGKSLTEVLPPELADGLMRSVEQAMASDEPCTLEYSVPISGENRFYEARVVRCDSDRVLSIVRDMTERKQAEHQARGLRDELAHVGRITTLAALTGSLAHELNQPLAAIRTNAQAALRLIALSRPDLGELRAALADIITDNQRAADVIRRLRALLKKDTSEYAPLDLNASVEEVVKFLEGDMMARRISVEVDLASDLPRVLGDRVQLQQVTLNLLMNACEAVEDRDIAARRVMLRTTTTDSRVIVSVTDQGIRLTDEQLGLVFEPFYTTKADGMGLGLPICQTIMNAHDGTVGAERNADQGMTFSFSLPVWPPAPHVSSEVFVTSRFGSADVSE